MSECRSRADTARELIHTVDAIEQAVNSGKAPQPLGPDLLVSPDLRPLVSRVWILAQALDLVEPRRLIHRDTTPSPRTVRIPGMVSPVLFVPNRRVEVEWVEPATSFYEWILSLREKAKMLLATDGSANAVAPEPSSPAERAREIALEVDLLYHQGRNEAEFRRQIQAWEKEEAARRKERERAETAKHEALKALRDEREAVKAGKRKPRLTDRDNPPGPGWGWRDHEDFIEGCDAEGRPLVEYVSGWCPPNVCKHLTQPEEHPRPAPSLAYMFAALALAHDKALPGSPPIFSRLVSDKLAEVALLAEGFNDDTFTSLTQLEDAPVFGRSGVDRLRTYFNAVKAALDRRGKVEAGKADQTDKDAKTQKEAALRKRFSFGRGQAFLDGRDLNLPTGLPVEVLKKLVAALGRTVSHQTLHEASNEFEASDELRGAIRAIRKVLKAKKAPCCVVSRRGEGYLIR